jgi:hypothetical protein
VDGVHSFNDNEDTCIEIHVAEPTAFQSTYNVVYTVLENSSLGWEKPNEVNFLIASELQCSETPDLDVYEIEIHIWDDVGEDGPCSSKFVACITWVASSSVHPCSCASGGDDTDYTKVRLHFAFADVAAGGPIWRAFLNHETGHAMGLADPTAEPGVVDTTAEHCLVEVRPGIAAPVASIMHSGRCPQVAFPLEWPAECARGTNPRDVASTPSAAQCGGTTDADLDGLTARAERCKWGTVDGVVDSDGDGRADCVEANDIDGNGVQNFPGDTTKFAQASFNQIGQTMVFDLNGDAFINFPGDATLSAKMAFHTDGICLG